MSFYSERNALSFYPFITDVTSNPMFNIRLYSILDQIMSYCHMMTAAALTKLGQIHDINSRIKSKYCAVCPLVGVLVCGRAGDYHPSWDHSDGGGAGLPGDLRLPAEKIKTS